MLLVIDFVNLKIKSAQSFRCVYKDMVCVYVYIGINDHMYISIYIYTVFFKKLVLYHSASICSHQPQSHSHFVRAFVVLLSVPRPAWDDTARPRPMLTVYVGLHVSGPT
jgi:hypothetical protein